MKKKLEAELISIAHRILKLKNRAELDVLRDETLKLYEKLSVLKFVEDNFSDVKPTIGYASAEAKLDEIYESPLTAKWGTAQEVPEVKATEVEAPVAGGEETEVAPTEPSADTKEAEPEKEKESGEEETQNEAATEEAPKAEAKEDKENGESSLTPEEGTEEEEAPLAPKGGAVAAEITIDAEVGLHPEEEKAITEIPELPATGGLSETEGQDKDNGAGEGVETPGGKPAVSTEEKKNTEASGVLDFSFEKKEAPVKQKEISFEDFHDYKEPEFVKKGSPETPAAPAQPAEPATSAAEVDDWRNWQPNKATETPAPPKEEPKAEATKYDPISDWRNWEPNKSATAEQPKAAPVVDDWMNWEPSKSASAPVPETPKEEPKPAPAVDDWRNWEPSKSVSASVPETPKEEPKAAPAVDDWRNWEPSKSVSASVPETPKEEPKAAPVLDDWKNWEPAKTETPKPETTNYTTPAAPEPVAAAPTAAPKVNGGFVRAMSLGLNDRIAFEKNLFGGSSEDLNRVVSQLNTLNTFEEAKDFIADLVKPDYNNWKGKEEFEERFMQLVEKKFSNV